MKNRQRVHLAVAIIAGKDYLNIDELYVLGLKTLPENYLEVKALAAAILCDALDELDNQSDRMIIYRDSRDPDWFDR